jgi:hypothetical protein
VAERVERAETGAEGQNTMSDRTLTPVDPRAARSYPALRGIAYAQPGTVIVGDDGTTLRIRADGGADEVLPPGHPRAGIASDPTAARR